MKLKELPDLEHLYEVNISVYSLEPTGTSKVRYVGGWAISKILENLRKFVKVNIYRENKKTLQKVH